jgi:hypothetical protein
VYLDSGLLKSGSLEVEPESRAQTQGNDSGSTVREKGVTEAGWGREKLSKDVVSVGV